MATSAGWVMLPMLVSMAVAGVFSGRLAQLVPFKLQLAGASAVIALSCVALALLHRSIWDVAVISGVYGVGLGLAYAALTSVIVQSVPASQTGTAIGMNANIRTIGGAIGTAVMTAVVTAQHAADGVPAEQGFVSGFLLFAGVAALAMVVSLLIPGNWRRHAAPAAPAPAE